MAIPLPGNGIPRDLSALAKQIQTYRVEGSDDIRKLTELCRALEMDVGEVIDAAEYEIRDALKWYDRGNSRRARQVTRPFRHAETLNALAARRCVQVYRTYLKVFSPDLARDRTRGQRRFDPEK